MGSEQAQKRRSAILVNGALLLIVLIWTIPVLGLFVSSFRDRFGIQTSGWWAIFPHREWQVTETIDPREAGLDAQQPMDVAGLTGVTFEELRDYERSIESKAGWRRVPAALVAGDITDGSAPCGAIAGIISEVLSAHEVVRRIADGYEPVIARLKSFT